MASVIVYVSGDPVHDYVLQAFADGCPEGAEIRPVQEYVPSDLAVVFGVFKSQVPFSRFRGAVIENQRQAKKKVIILETGYVRRGDGPEDYYAAGFGGLNGRADFRNHNSPGDRWKALDVPLKPWHVGDKVMLAAQVPWDASVDHLDYIGWLMATAKRLRSLTCRPLVFRPHPKAKLPELEGFEHSTGPVDWSDFGACVTLSSNMAVEGVINGVPAFVDDVGAMTLPVANRGLEAINVPARPDRTQWANDLAYAQWTPQEMREGKAWRHLFR